MREKGTVSSVPHSHIHEEAGGAIGIHPNVSTALHGGLVVCFVVLALVPDGHLGPVGTLHLFDIRDVLLCETSIGVNRLDFHSFLSWGSWRGIRR